MFSIIARNDEISIEIISNGFIMSVNGRTKDYGYVTKKIHFNTLEELFIGMKEFVAIPEND